MKIVVQNFKTGKLSVADTPQPRLRPGGVLVRVTASLISAGTDRAVIGLAKKGPLGKAKDRPDLMRKVLNKAKTDGLWATYKVVQNLVTEPIPLGYSVAGIVTAVGSDVHDVKVGDRVACAGLGYANHAEIIFVPKNLFVPVPNDVPDSQATYVTLGAIAMHGVRQANQQLGASILVVGLGLVGQIAVQICRAGGYRVIGLDLDKKKCEFAVNNGAHAAFEAKTPNLHNLIQGLTDGQGVDAVLVTAASRKSGEVLNLVAELCRDRARVVVVGDVKMDLERRRYFDKELEIVQSRSYGPGRYDPNYEEKGQDYPIGYVRWTERRNMQVFLQYLADNRLDVSGLTTHTYPHAEAEKAYSLVTDPGDQFIIGILLTYPEGGTEFRKDAVSPAPAPVASKHRDGNIGLGVIGTGKFAKGILLPALMGTKSFDLVGVASAGGLSADSVKNKYGADYAVADAERILADESIQAVVIATRPNSHARYVTEALAWGKHVFVEKPLCLTMKELDDIKDAAISASATLTVGYNRRFSPFIEQIRKHFQGCGEPMAMSYRANAGRIELGSEGGWVHDPKVGGGRIIGEVCHFVDTMQAVCGGRPNRVFSVPVIAGNSKVPGDDIVTIVINFDDGSVGTVHYWSNGDASYPKERMEVFCQERIAILDNYRRLDLVSANRTRTKRAMSQQKGFAEEAQAFVDACRTGVMPIDLESLIDTSLVTFFAVEDLCDPKELPVEMT
jgi:polar amino acid transport system substrate-binding protein